MSYVQLARSSFNDEEMYQLLIQYPPFGELKLRRHFRRSRGLILSKNLDLEELVRFYSRIGFSWKEFEHLSSHLGTEENRDKQSSLKIPCHIPAEIIETAFSQLRELRKNDESYIRTANTKAIDLKATYVKTDFTKSKARQREKRSVMIGIKIDDSETEISYDSDERAALIVSQLVKEIRKASTTVLPSECEIAFSGAGREERQTRFFLSLTRGLDKYNLINVSDVKVSRGSAPTLNKDDEDEDEDINDSVKEDFKGLIKSAVLKGEDVTSSRLFQQLMADGYFICGISWFAREVGGEERKIELEAGFKEDKIRNRFFADAKRIFGKTVDKDDELTGSRLPPFKRSFVQDKIISAAYKLVETLAPPPDEE